MRILRFNNKGWRERYNNGFDAENVARAADAFAYIWADAHPGATVLVGYDTRYQGKEFADVVGGVLSGYGLRAVVSDAPCPTPALGWNVAQDDQVVGGVMLTASSASCEYGGISARGADGGPVSDDFYDAATQIVTSAVISDRGEVEYADLTTPYLVHLKRCVDAEAIAEAAPHVVVDPMYGSARGYLAELLTDLGCRVTQIHADNAPDFGGLHPCPAEPWVDKCEQAIIQSHNTFGLVLDGDGDRLGIVDERGRFVTPHRMVPLILEHLVEDRLQSGRVVATHSSSAYVRRQAARLGCPFTMVPMGFTRIYREFVEGDVVLGSEELGGVCVPSHMAERDGLFAALLMVESVAMRGASIGDLVADLERNVGTMHYISRDIRLDAASIQSFRNVLPGLNLREVCGKEPVSVHHSDGLLLRFADDSWVQLRPSRTEPIVRANAEAPNVREAEALAEATCRAAQQWLR